MCFICDKPLLLFLINQKQLIIHIIRRKVLKKQHLNHSSFYKSMFQLTPFMYYDTGSEQSVHAERESADLYTYEIMLVVSLRHVYEV